MKDKEKKYKLTKECKREGVRVLYRIEALKDFCDVERGDKGGWVESERNLSQDGNAWIYDDAEVFGKACVVDDARVRNKAKVFGTAVICNKAQIYDNARIYYQAVVQDHVKIFDNAKIYGYAIISDYAKVYKNAKIYGYACVDGRAMICGDAVINSCEYYIVFQNFWSSGRYFTYTTSNKMWKVGCFYGTGEELIRKAYADNADKGWHYEQVVRYVEAVEKRR